MLPVILQKPSDLCPAFQHPLHVWLMKSAFCDDGDCKDEGDEFVGVLLKDNVSTSDHSFSSLLVSVHVYMPEESDDSEFLPLFVTSMFIDHYGFRYDEKLVLKRAFCIPIEKVVFGARNRESYLWSKTSEWHQHLLLAICRERTLCRIGDVLLASPSFFSLNDETFDVSMLLDFITLDCQPVGQGLLTVNTTVVITDISDASYESKTSNSEEDLTTEQSPEVTNMISYLNLMNYTSSLLLSGFANFAPFKVNPIAKSFAASSKMLRVLRNRFRIQIIPKLSADLIKTFSSTEHKIDPLNTLFLSKIAMQKLGIKSADWVKIKMLSNWKAKVRRWSSNPLPESASVTEDEGGESKRHRHSSGMSDVANEMQNDFRLAIAYTLLINENEATKSGVENTVYISPHLWFNLNKHPSTLIQPANSLIVEPFLPDSEVSSPPYATEVYVSLVQSPNYNGTIRCENMLSNYFKIPRYICKGDIFCISTRDDVTFHQKLDDPLNVKCPIVYFRVSMIEGPSTPTGYIINKDHCRLYQTGTAQSYIPATMETFYSNSHVHPIWNGPMPSGLKCYIEMLQELIVPFLKLRNTRSQVSSNILLTGSVCCGKTAVVRAVCKCLNLHLYQINCHELSGESAGSTEARLKIVIEKGPIYSPCLMLLRNIDFIGKEKEATGEDPRVMNTLCELLKSLSSSGGEWPVITVATSSQMKLMSNDLASSFLHHIHMEPPNEEERTAIIEDLLVPCIVGNDVSISYLAQRTAGFVLGDLSALVSLAAQAAYSRVKELICKHYANTIEDEEDVAQAGIPIIQQDLLHALDKLQSAHAQAIGAPKIPNVHWEDVGGLADVKKEILDTIQLPLEHPEILASGLRRSGVLLYGPPGTGKTLLAKAVATECSLNFLSVKGPELINMYVGQSEENVREVFHRARSAAPCIIFFDELDSLAPNRGRSGDSGGVMDRVVSQLLAEIDGLSKSAEVFVIGATNRPDLIDPALLRPGRFDRLLYVGIPEDKESRLKIMTALTRRFQLSEDVVLEDIVDKCPVQLTGADFYSLCSNALTSRIGRNVKLIEEGQLQMEDAKLIVQTEDFDTALESLIPSVSTEELARYQKIKLAIAT